MIEIKLTNDDWFVLYSHIDQILKEYPNSKHLKSIVEKLEEKEEEVLSSFKNSSTSSNI